MKRTLYIAGGFTLAFLMPFNLQAQNTQPKDTTMNRTVVVEQEYRKWNMPLLSSRLPLSLPT